MASRLENVCVLFFAHPLLCLFTLGQKNFSIVKSRAIQLHILNKSFSIQQSQGVYKEEIHLAGKFLFLPKIGLWAARLVLKKRKINYEICAMNYFEAKRIKGFFGQLFLLFYHSQGCLSKTPYFTLLVLSLTRFVFVFNKLMSFF